jgi:hypothetical protein
MIKATIVPSDYINVVWPSIKTYLKGAADYTYGRFDIEDIYAGLFTRPQQLWVAYDDSDNSVYGAVVTEVIEYPRMKALVMHFTGGEDLPKWKTEMLELLKEFAKSQQCSIIESYGRRGWSKVFKDDGYEERFTFYELPVGN